MAGPVTLGHVLVLSIIYFLYKNFGGGGDGGKKVTASHILVSDRDQCLALKKQLDAAHKSDKPVAISREALFPHAAALFPHAASLSSYRIISPHPPTSSPPSPLPHSASHATIPKQTLHAAGGHAFRFPRSTAQHLPVGQVGWFPRYFLAGEPRGAPAQGSYSSLCPCPLPAYVSASG